MSQKACMRSSDMQLVIGLFIAHCPCLYAIHVQLHCDAKLVLILSFSLLQEVEEARRNSLDAPTEDGMANVARVTEDWLLKLRFRNFVQFMSTKYGENVLQL
jgi:hypothetical protein